MYIVGTPIGNLGDITLRALETLGAVGMIAAEDTRIASRLLDHYSLSKTLIPLHQHNEAATVKKIAGALSRGISVALITDAGTPGISDPGALLVNRIRHLGYHIVPIPGPNAAVCAFSAAGIIAPHFFFYGFLPASGQARRRELRNLVSLPYTLVFYEAPHRILDSIGDIQEILGERRQITIARELTKLFETIHVCPLAEAIEWLQADPNRQKGEFVLLLSGAETVKERGEQNLSDQAQHTLKALLDALPLAQAVRLAADITGESRRSLYAHALLLRNGQVEKKTT
ncbi:MAG TPA: 16S rRNA (cytidine(1402)-2'-O)-methyltransferase [Nitrosospira sp.]|nr:16S rRNA (cytidine(1402)-2'-O)-methyltransferase [Nitrosospira sp.]